MEYILTNYEVDKKHLILSVFYIILKETFCKESTIY